MKWARPLLLLGGLLGAGLLLRLLPDGGATALLHRIAGQPGPLAAAEIFALGAALCAVGVPRQVVAYGAGLAFGAVPGIVLALAAQLAGCVADLMWARSIGRDFARRRLGGRLARIDARLSARPFVATLALRLLPVGNNLLLNLAAGLSGVAAGRFVAASALGYLPQTAVFALIGSGTRIGHATQLALAAGLFVAAGLLGAAVLRREPVSAAGC